MSAASVGELHFIDGIMNSRMYWSILKEKMQPSLYAVCFVLHYILLCFFFIPFHSVLYNGLECPERHFK